MANKLELTWYGKDEPIRVEPRLLIENTELSNTAADPETQNMLIHGDNLLALKALESKFAGQVKCIYIDPPYNTGSAFEHYDDNLEHSIWLNLMRPRLEILWNLLDGTVGSLWISIDDSEQAYMRVLCDELFGRHNFVAQNVWQKRYSRENREAIGDAHEYIIVYAKNPARFKESRNLVPMSEEQAKVYKNPNNDPKGRWMYGDNVFEKRGIRRDRTGGSGKGRYLQGKTGILKRDGPASASVSLKMFEREGVDVVGVLFSRLEPPRARRSRAPRRARCEYRKTPESLINGHFRGFFCAYG